MIKFVVFKASDDDYREVVEVNSLEEFAELINSSEEWKLEFNDIIKKNGWEDLTDDDWDVCREDNRRLTFVEEREGMIVVIKEEW